MLLQITFPQWKWGGEHPAHQIDALDQRALDARSAYITQSLDRVRQMKDTLEHAIDQADQELQGGADHVNAARGILRTAYRNCKALKARFFNQMMAAGHMPGEHREPKLMLLDGARIAQDKFLQRLEQYGRPADPAMPGMEPDLPYAGHPIMGPGPMGGETLREIFADILPFSGEGYMDHEWESVATFFMYCEQPHQ